MDKLAADPELARRMGINARQRLEEKYDLARHMQAAGALSATCRGENDHQRHGIRHSRIPDVQGGVETHCQNLYPEIYRRAARKSA